MVCFCCFFVCNLKFIVCKYYWNLNARFLSLSAIERSTELSTRSSSLLERACALASLPEKRSGAPGGVLVADLHRGLGLGLRIQLRFVVPRLTAGSC